MENLPEFGDASAPPTEPPSPKKPRRKPVKRKAAKIAVVLKAAKKRRLRKMPPAPKLPIKPAPYVVPEETKITLAILKLIKRVSAEKQRHILDLVWDSL